MRPFLPLAVALAFSAPARAGDPPAPPAPPEPVDHPRALMYAPRFREGPPERVLVRSPVPLERAHLDAQVDLVEAAFDLALTPDEEQALRDGIETAWPKASDAARASVLGRPAEKAAILAALRRGDGAGAQRLLATVAADLARGADAAPSAPENAPVVAARRRAATVHSAGDPPVSLADQNALEEVVLFLLRLARNEDALVTEGQRAALRAKTKAALDASGALVRRRHDRANRLWLLLEARWDAAGEDERLRMRWTAVRLFRWLLGLAPSPETSDGAGGAQGGLADYAARAREVAGAKDAFQQVALAFGNPEAVVTAAVSIAGFGKDEVDRAFAVDTLSLR
jgi:hypothetical protein